MTNSQTAIVAIPCAIAAMCLGLAFVELHGLRISTDALSPKLDKLIAHVDDLRKPPESTHAVCRKEQSHADHDVDVGPVNACPNPDDGRCITWHGETITVSAADARCKAGKLQ